MARPRSFSTDDALDAASDVFRRLGYQAASVQDLVDATGLSRSSLYAAFGDKHGLYLAVLDRYRVQGHSLLAERLSCPGDASPIGAIRAYLDSVTEERGEGGAPPLGCLLTNAAAEVASRDPETAQRASDAAHGLARTFQGAIERAQTAGEIPATRDAQALGRFLAGAVYGLRGLQKSGAEGDVLADVVETTMAAVRR